jgi:hypothetical protein
LFLFFFVFVGGAGVPPCQRKLISIESSKNPEND